MHIDKQYFSIIDKILKEGKRKENRTGIDTISISGCMVEHDMSEGFPILTTKRIAWKTLKVELEGFIKGVTNKQWFQDRGCKIWNEWCNPTKVPYGHDEATKLAMLEEKDLGPVYGYQWRNFNGRYDPDEGVFGDGVDQLAWAINQLKTNPNNRRIIVNAWNPQQLNQMALVPCHYSFQLLHNEGELDLLWNQRSCDVGLGIPFNIASYGLLLELIAKECGFKAGKLVGFLADTHIYVNHLKALEEQMSRDPYQAPTLELGEYESIFKWTHKEARLNNYQFHESVKMEVAI